MPPPRIYPNVGELPPLARGKVWGGNKGYGFRGITPARAGKSWAQILPGKVAWNYPRSRGEKCPNSVSIFCLMELPPLARGKAYPKPVLLARVGITPARAGKRRIPPRCEYMGRNYPRSRGEKGSSRCMRPVGQELPPLARGKASLMPCPDASQGITPARAGKSASAAKTLPLSRNYPRSRGEKPHK